MGNRYNGWKNYETWNVALWISNDEGLYNYAREFESYKSFAEAMRDTAPAHQEGDGPSIAFETPDGVAWNDSGLDIPALDELICELRAA